jgi:3-isopropylmalate dehydrogenase
VYNHVVFEDTYCCCIDKTGPLPEQTLNLCINTDAVLFGAIGDPSMTMIRSKVRPDRIVKIEKRIRSFANIRPIKPYQRYASLFEKEIIEGADFIILEN